MEQEKKDWLIEEYDVVMQPDENTEKLPYPIFAQNKITMIEVDAREPFKEWIDKENGKKKAIIPCTSLIEGKYVKCKFWLNKHNPIYKEIIKACRDAPDRANVVFNILQTGSKEKTQYQIIKI